MKGIILQCAINLVKDQFGGDETLKKILSEMGINEEMKVVVFEDLPDEMCLDFIKAAAKVLGVTEDDVMLAFGDYWVNVFAYRKYRVVYAKYKTAREFLIGMDKTHAWATQSIDGATPPQFVFETLNDDTLLMHYISARALDKILEGLIKGVLRFFKEEGVVERIESDRPEACCAFKITFRK